MSGEKTRWLASLALVLSPTFIWTFPFLLLYGPCSTQCQLYPQQLPLSVGPWSWKQDLVGSFQDFTKDWTSPSLSDSAHRSLVHPFLWRAKLLPFQLLSLNWTATLWRECVRCFGILLFVRSLRWVCQHFLLSPAPMPITCWSCGYEWLALICFYFEVHGDTLWPTLLKMLPMRGAWGGSAG